MSVLACGRPECEEVMCSRLILGGERYICDDCWKELLICRTQWPETMPVSEVRKRIEEFMDTKPGIFKELDAAGIDEEFKRLTADGDD
jgi:hypothetical protein